jgi:hypothetical protein
MYAQYKNGIFRELYGNIVFSPTVYQSAESLTDEQRAEFEIYTVVDHQPAPAEGFVYAETWSYEVVGTDIHRTWSVRPMNAQELASKAEAARATAKQVRQAAVDAIKVTTAAGNTFDGDETSQGRMARAIIALSTGLAPSVAWVLADNTVIHAAAAELTEALVLSGQAQASV